MALPRVEFRQSVDPAVTGSVCGTGVEEARFRREIDRLPRSGVGQAEHHDICLVEQFAATGNVLAQMVLDGEQLDLGVACQPGREFKSRRAGLAVDEDPMGHVGAHGQKRGL